MNIGSLFSGIGAPEQAAINVFGRNEVNIIFACDNGERDLGLNETEIDSKLRGLSAEEKQEWIKEAYSTLRKPNFVYTSYMANYSDLLAKDAWYDDVRFLNGNPFRNQLDLLVGGSPCQSFSAMGKKKGLDDARGTLFFDYGRIIKETQPKAFIYENVPGMLTLNNGDTWERIEDVFNSLGYTINKAILDASKYGIPQKRRRLFVVGLRGDQEPFSFPDPIKLSKKAFAYYDDKIDPKYYFKQKGFAFVTTNHCRASINNEIIRTEKANQQFNWNGDFVFEKLDEKKHLDERSRAIQEGAFVGTYKNDIGLARKLTPHECLKLMGFPNDFKMECKDSVMYRQAGNSMVVNVIEALIEKLKDENRL